MPEANGPEANGPEANGLRLLGLSAGIIAADQASKYWIVSNYRLYEPHPLLPVLDITRLHNPGAAFSFLATEGGWQRWFFTLLALLVSGAIIQWLRSLDTTRQKLLAVGLALVLGGALGNVIDRIRYGYVVDFIHAHWNQAYFPAFNVADAAISIGAALIVLDALFDWRRSRSGAVA
jgi:signal peptidase II